MSAQKTAMTPRNAIAPPIFRTPTPDSDMCLHHSNDEWQCIAVLMSGIETKTGSVPFRAVRLAGWKFLAGRIHYSGQSWNNCGIGVRGVPPGGDTGNGCSEPRVVDQRVEDGSQTTSTGAEAMEWSVGESGWSRCQEARRPKQWRRGQ